MISQQELISEKNHIVSLINRLSSFMDTLEYTDLPIEEQCLLDEQWDVMDHLIRILSERIEKATFTSHGLSSALTKRPK